MIDMSGIETLHFLRPLWLMALPLAAFVWWRGRREHDPARALEAAIAPHLLRHLLVGRSAGARVRPSDMGALIIVLMILALAGPSWRRELPPFVENIAPLVIAIDASQSMAAADVAPSRLARAAQKVRDLIARRADARTALVVYAGSAHVVLPLTNDPGLIVPFLDALSPDLMPVAGKNPSAALALAREITKGESVESAILFMTDKLTPADAAMLAGEAGGIHVLLVAADATTAAPFASGLDIVALSPDDSDVERLASNIQARYELRQGNLEHARWRDEGYFLLWPVVALGALWFRRGWAVRMAVLLPLAFTVLGGGSAHAAGAEFLSPWLSAGQQGRFYFERGEYAIAAARFQDPMWRGAALYRLGDYAGAADAFSQVPTPEGAYNLGNAHALAGKLEDALAAYDLALALRPSFEAAHRNRSLVSDELAARKKTGKDENDEEGAPPSLEADDMKVDEKADKGTPGDVDAAAIMSTEAARAWMRQVENRPADFLRGKFAIEAARQRGGAR
tara:strand:+ start:20720 stop:22249 length:1530 start_codon:yes stop_codon:yes gene_type:complete